MERFHNCFGKIPAFPGFAIREGLASWPGLRFALVIAIATTLGASSEAQVPLAPNAPIVEIEIGYTRGMTGSGGGTEINLAHDFKSVGGAGGGAGPGLHWSVHEECEVLSYDADHVRLSVKLKKDSPGTGRLSGDLSTYSAVVDVTREKPVILAPFENITVRLSMKSNPAAADAGAGTPHP
jgi:hypothetical protein